MKHNLKLFFIVLFLLPGLACNTVVPNSVQGSGKIIKQTVDVSNFASVSLEGSGNVNLVQGKSESLTIEADDNIMPLLDTRVRGNELVLGIKPGQNINPSKPIVYRLSVKDLNAVSLRGSGNFYMEPVRSKDMKVSVFGSGDINMKGLDADSLSINLSGSGNVTIGKIAVKTIDTTVNGSGDIQLDGQSDRQTITVNGSGNYTAGDLETASADITIPGSSDVTVWVKDTLKAHISGSGNVKYYGSPTLDQSVSGSGKLISLGAK